MAIPVPQDRQGKRDRLVRLDQPAQQVRREPQGRRERQALLVLRERPALLVPKVQRVPRVHRGLQDRLDLKVSPVSMAMMGTLVQSVLRDLRVRSESKARQDRLE